MMDAISAAAVIHLILLSDAIVDGNLLASALKMAA